MRLLILLLEHFLEVLKQDEAKINQIHTDQKKGFTDIMAGIAEIKALEATEHTDLVTLGGLVTQLLTAFANETLTPADAQALLDDMTTDNTSVKSNISAITAALNPSGTPGA